MFPILEARSLAPHVKLFRIQAPWVARKRRAGQFVVVRAQQEGERIPLTVVDSSSAEGTVTLVVHGVDSARRRMNRMGQGDALFELVGPLGVPVGAERFGTAVLVCGGAGTAVAYPSAVALKRAGNRVVSILGAQTWDRVILEEEMNAASDLLIVATLDGSHGLHGRVTQALADRIAAEPVDRVYAAGPPAMRREVAELARASGIPAVLGLEPVLAAGPGGGAGESQLPNLTASAGTPW